MLKTARRVKMVCYIWESGNWNQRYLLSVTYVSETQGWKFTNCLTYWPWTGLSTSLKIIAFILNAFSLISRCVFSLRSEFFNKLKVLLSKAYLLQLFNCWWFVFSKRANTASSPNIFEYVILSFMTLKTSVSNHFKPAILFWSVHITHYIIHTCLTTAKHLCSTACFSVGLD